MVMVFLAGENGASPKLGPRRTEMGMGSGWVVSRWAYLFSRVEPLWCNKWGNYYFFMLCPPISTFVCNDLMTLRDKTYEFLNLYLLWYLSLKVTWQDHSPFLFTFFFDTCLQEVASALLDQLGNLKTEILKHLNHDRSVANSPDSIRTSQSHH